MKPMRSMRERVSEAEWDLRVNLAACYRLVAKYGMTDLIYNHITARVPGPEHHILISAYGMLYAVTHAELDRLYTAPGLEHYRPEAVIAHPLGGTPTPALCYNLREAPRPQERNPDYAERLRRALTKLEFPPDYIASVE